MGTEVQQRAVTGDRTPSVLDDDMDTTDDLDTTIVYAADTRLMPETRTRPRTRETAVMDTVLCINGDTLCGASAALQIPDDLISRKNRAAPSPRLENSQNTMAVLRVLPLFDVENPTSGLDVEKIAQKTAIPENAVEGILEHLALMGCIYMKVPQEGYRATRNADRLLRILQKQ